MIKKIIIFILFIPYLFSSDKCEAYKDIIKKELSNYKNTPFTVNIICGVIAVESSYRKNVISSYGAVGLMQVTLHVLNDYNLFARKEKIIFSFQTKEVENNIKLGIWYLHRSYRQVKKYEDIKTVSASLSAYYWGLTRAIKKEIVITNYSNKVLENAKLYKQD